MKSHLDKKDSVLAKKARKARRKRLEIRRTKTAGLKPHLYFGENKDACSCARKRSFDYTDETSPRPPADRDVSGKDKKLKWAVESTSGDLGFSSSDSTKNPAPGDRDKQPEEEVGEREGLAGEVEDRGRMTRLNCGSVSVIGRRRVMEDALTVAPGIGAGGYEFFAAYDGHGGARVANACRDRMHHLVKKELQASTGDKVNESGVDWSKVMKACFSRMDEQVVVDNSSRGAKGLEVGEAERAVGSTAVVVMVGPEELVVANCGDSRAVLCRGGVAMALSNDHKPDRPDEKERVEAAGGRIINWDGSRVQGVLATSRSIGDHYLKPYVISEPEVNVYKRTDSDGFLIIATDGLWDVVSNDVACEVVRRCLNGQISRRFSKEPGAAEAAAILAELAIAKGSRDNISVIVVDLKSEQQSFQ